MNALPTKNSDRDDEDPEVLTGKIADPDELDEEFDEDEDDEEDEDEEVEVSPDLTFETKAKDRTGDRTGEKIRFRVDGRLLTAVRPPEYAFMLVTTASARSTPMAEKMASIIQFLGEALTEESGVYLRDRLLDKDDDLEFDDLLPILQRLSKAWRKSRRKPGSNRRPLRGRR